MDDLDTASLRSFAATAPPYKLVQWMRNCLPSLLDRMEASRAEGEPEQLADLAVGRCRHIPECLRPHDWACAACIAETLRSRRRP